MQLRGFDAFCHGGAQESERDVSGDDVYGVIVTATLDDDSLRGKVSTGLPCSLLADCCLCHVFFHQS